MRNCIVHHDEPHQIFFDNGEHGLEIEHRDCDEGHGRVTWNFCFTILCNHTFLTKKNAKQLIAWLQKELG